MIIYLNCDDNNTTYNKKNYLLRAAEQMGWENKFRDFNRWHPSEEIQFVLNIVPYTKFQVGTQWTGVWEIDQICGRQQEGQDWPYCDTIFLPAIFSKLPEQLQHDFSEKFRLLFQACDPILHEKNGSGGYAFVQCGMGGDGTYEERSRLIRLLRDHGYDMHDFGKDYKPENYVKNISKAKIQFIRSGKTPIADGEIAQRFFECLAIGPVLTNWVEDLNYTGLIENEDYMAYRSDKELIEKMDILLKDDALRDRIARNGRNKALMYHSYGNRLASIFNIAMQDRK